MFIDHARIFVKAGDGGNGCMAFRREKFVPRGGPSGGDGGNGGNVYFRSSTQLNTLLPFKYQQHFQAGHGQHGSGNRRHGRNGEDLEIDVPVGTQVYDDSGQLFFDMDVPGKTELAAEGGKGGRGNAAFASSTNQAPRRCEPGAPGEERVFVLELKILADVGLIGYPNAGKSTLISVISSARPKIADYPFTTLTPNLGVVPYGEYRSFVVADIPGLIEGAHAGSGLGDQFLRHVERTRLLLHLVDVSDVGPADAAGALQAINRELELYNPDLLKKPQFVVATKIDAADDSKIEQLRLYCRRHQLIFYEISAITGKGIQELKDAMAAQLGITAD
ncbi:MAG: GTPase ObgE [Acidobacteria bacterium]|nr:GTPase ObgE [Acidobacteriota bacterium]